MSEVPACIDQMTAQVGDLFGRDSKTYRELLKLTVLSQAELGEIEQYMKDKGAP